MPVRIGERYHERYQVLERIGEGAFAHVYRAKEISDGGREVALKVLKDPYLTVKDVVERFQREVFAVASISSPHVVALHDFGISDEDFFIVMEFVRGPTLRDLMRARTWTAADIHVIVGQIAHALAAAHKQDIVHRDLKPENVMLVERADSRWQAKVLDFGFAKLPELERKLGLEPLTRKGSCFGTPQYLSPEQIRGKPVDGGADLFALGVIAYEMLAGRRPWDGDDPREVMMAVLKQLPPAVTRLPEGLAPRIEEVNRFLLRILAKERAERPPDAQTFFKELGHALFGSAVPVLKGAAPEAPLDSVSSQSIELKVRTQRVDQTEVNPVDDRETIQFVTERSGRPTALNNDTVRQDAYDSSNIDIPIYVSAGGEHARSFQSGYHASLSSPEPRRAPEDSQKATLPRETLPLPPVRAPAGSFTRILGLLVLMAAVAGVAFLVGRYLR